MSCRPSRCTLHTRIGPSEQTERDGGGREGAVVCLTGHTKEPVFSPSECGVKTAVVVEEREKERERERPFGHIVLT